MFPISSIISFFQTKPSSALIVSGNIPNDEDDLKFFLEFYKAEPDLFLDELKKTKIEDKDIIDANGLVIHPRLLFFSKKNTHSFPFIQASIKKLFNDPLNKSDQILKDCFDKLFDLLTNTKGSINFAGGFVIYLIDVSFEGLLKESELNHLQLPKYCFHNYTDIDIHINLEKLNPTVQQVYKELCSLFHYKPTFLDMRLNTNNQVNDDVQYLHLAGKSIKHDYDFSFSANQKETNLFSIDEGKIVISENGNIYLTTKKRPILQIGLDIRLRILRLAKSEQISHKSFWKIILYITKGYRSLDIKSFELTAQIAFQWLIPKGFAEGTFQIINDFVKNHSKSLDFIAPFFINIYYSNLLKFIDLKLIHKKLKDKYHFESSSIYNGLLHWEYELEDYFCIFNFIAYLSLLNKKEVSKVSIIEHFEKKHYYINDENLFCLIPVDIDNTLQHIEKIVQSDKIVYFSKQILSLFDKLINFENLIKVPIQIYQINKLEKIALHLIIHDNKNVKIIGLKILLLIYIVSELICDSLFIEKIPLLFSFHLKNKNILLNLLLHKIGISSKKNIFKQVCFLTNDVNVLSLGWILTLRENSKYYSSKITLKKGIEKDKREICLNFLDLFLQNKQTNIVSYCFSLFCHENFLQAEDILFLYSQFEISPEAQEVFANYLFTQEITEKKSLFALCDAIKILAKKNVLHAYLFWKKTKKLHADQKNQDFYNDCLKVLQEKIFVFFRNEINDLSLILDLLDDTYQNGLWIEIIDIQAYFDTMLYINDLLHVRKDLNINQKYLLYSKEIDFKAIDLEKFIKKYGSFYTIHLTNISLKKNLIDPSHLEEIIKKILIVHSSKKNKTDLDKEIFEQLLHNLFQSKKILPFNCFTVDLIFLSIFKFYQKTFPPIIKIIILNYASNKNLNDLLSHLIKFKDKDENLIFFIIKTCFQKKFLPQNFNQIVNYLIHNKNIDVLFIYNNIYEDLDIENKISLLRVVIKNFDLKQIKGLEQKIEHSSFTNETIALIKKEIYKNLSKRSKFELLQYLIDQKNCTPLEITFFLKAKKDLLSEFFYNQLKKNKVAYFYFLDTNYEIVLKNAIDEKIYELVNDLLSIFLKKNLCSQFLKLILFIDPIINNDLISFFEENLEKLYIESYNCQYQYRWLEITTYPNISIQKVIPFLKKNLKVLVDISRELFLSLLEKIFSNKTNLTRFFDSETSSQIYTILGPDLLYNKSKEVFVYIIYKITDKNLVNKILLFFQNSNLQKDFINYLFEIDKKRIIQKDIFEQYIYNILKENSSLLNDIECLELILNQCSKILLDKIINKIVKAVLTLNEFHLEKIFYLIVRNKLTFNELTTAVLNQIYKLNKEVLEKFLDWLHSQSYWKIDEFFFISTMYNYINSVPIFNLKKFLSVAAPYYKVLDLRIKKSYQDKIFDTLRIFFVKLNNEVLDTTSLNPAKNNNLKCLFAFIDGSNQIELKNELKIFNCRQNFSFKNSKSFSDTLRIINQINVNFKSQNYLKLIEEMIYSGFEINNLGLNVSEASLLYLLNCIEYFPLRLLGYLLNLDLYSHELVTVLFNKLNSISRPLTNDEIDVIFLFINKYVSILNLNEPFLKQIKFLSSQKKYIEHQKQLKVANTLFSKEINLNDILLLLDKSNNSSLDINTIKNAAAEYCINILYKSFKNDSNLKTFFDMTYKVLSQIYHINVIPLEATSLQLLLEVAKKNIKNYIIKPTREVIDFDLKLENLLAIDQIKVRQLFETIVSTFLKLDIDNESNALDVFILLHCYLRVLVKYFPSKKTLKFLVDLTFNTFSTTNKNLWDLNTNYCSDLFLEFVLAYEKKGKVIPLFAKQKENPFHIQLTYTYYTLICHEKSYENFAHYFFLLIESKYVELKHRDYRLSLPIKILNFLIVQGQISINIVERYYLKACHLLFKLNYQKLILDEILDDFCSCHLILQNSARLGLDVTSLTSSYENLLYNNKSKNSRITIILFYDFVSSLLDVSINFHVEFPLTEILDKYLSLLLEYKTKETKFINTYCNHKKLKERILHCVANTKNKNNKHVYNAIIKKLDNFMK